MGYVRFCCQFLRPLDTSKTGYILIISHFNIREKLHKITKPEEISTSNDNRDEKRDHIGVAFEGTKGSQQPNKFKSGMQCFLGSKGIRQWLIN